MTTRSSTPAPDRKQGGAVLIVCLVMLTILTIIGIGTTTDISFQSNMVRNSQLRLNAFNTALSELNGQYRKMVDENSEDILTEALSTGQATIPAADLTQTSADNPFDQTASVVYLEEGLGQITGTTIGSATSNSAYYFELNSIVELDNTGVGSSQTSGIVRLAPTE
ncbi:PilX N-terminal domain-containing pilus assembly protein [uncultured Porticoccus sp.]|uniref:pilus assembly PilX family protein n=1 Tax=uncultured Porticoccus sp. TaxID=1256050 RepID=UPI0026147943|nr:PilX N-terminal domain-containing pilus assembly protein [uncultured Porticoccus sp.]